MKNQDALTRILAMGGTVLLWLPLVAPLFFTVALAIRAGIWRIDFLMPAELFVVALIGGGLLFWAARRSHRYPRMIGGAFAIAVCLLMGGQVLAIVSGLASGAIEPTGWSWALVLASIAGYTLALGVTGVGGLLLIRDLFKMPQSLPPTGRSGN